VLRYFLLPLALFGRCVSALPAAVFASFVVPLPLSVLPAAVPARFLYAAFFAGARRRGGLLFRRMISGSSSSIGSGGLALAIYTPSEGTTDCSRFEIEGTLSVLWSGTEYPRISL